MTKKLLLGSTALMAGSVVAAGVADAAEPLRLDVRGYKNEYFGLVDVDHDSIDYNETGLFSDGEVQFRGETALDNGITVGVIVEMEAFSAGDQIDENYVFVKGDFGRLVLGSENSAPYQTFWSVTAPGVGIPINSGWITSFTPPATGSSTGFRTPALTTNVDIHNDDNAISYYSPRFGGFQLMGSYIPTINNSGDGKNFPVEANTDTELHNGYSIGAHYTQDFNGFSLTAAGGFNRVKGETGTASVTDASITQYKAGINLGFGGFSIGGSFAKENSDRAQDGHSFDAGISYSTGPWGVSATYFSSEVEGTEGGDEDELDSGVIGVSYAIGPGVSVSGSLIYTEWEDESGADSESIGLVTGIAVRF